MVLGKFDCRGVILIWIRVGQGPNVLEVGAGGGCLGIFSLVFRFSFLFWGLLCCCFTSTINIYGHVGTVSQPDNTFPGQA